MMQHNDGLALHLQRITQNGLRILPPPLHPMWCSMVRCKQGSGIGKWRRGGHVCVQTEALMFFRWDCKLSTIFYELYKMHFKSFFTKIDPLVLRSIRGHSSSSSRISSSHGRPQGSKRGPCSTTENWKWMTQKNIKNIFRAGDSKLVLLHFITSLGVPWRSRWRCFGMKDKTLLVGSRYYKLQKLVWNQVNVGLYRFFGSLQIFKTVH